MKRVLKIKLDQEDLIPSYATEDSAGADLKANVLSEIEILPGESKLIPTGIFLDIPMGFEVQIRPRSGMALNHCITVLNTPGTIDSDYRGEVKVILINHSKKNFIVKPKMKIAQMILSPAYKMIFEKTDILSNTQRGTNGFGHSG